MENIQLTVQKLLELAGFNDCSIQADSENRKLAVFVNEGEWFKKILPNFVNDMDHVIRLVAKKSNAENVFIDVNNYRREREGLIIELAKAAARKALLTKSEVELPSMNAYERRLIHLVLATHQDVKSESIGVGKERRVIVKPSGL